jgi:hypothetical protein
MPTFNTGSLRDGDDVEPNRQQVDRSSTECRLASGPPKVMKNGGGASFSLQRRLQPSNGWRVLACSSTERIASVIAR